VAANRNREVSTDSDPGIGVSADNALSMRPPPGGRELERGMPSGEMPW